MSELEQPRAEIAALNAARSVIRLQTAMAADLFARDATLEIAARGQYRGQERIRSYLHELPRLEYGSVFNHMQLRPLITLAQDLQSARGRWRAIMEVGFLGSEELCGEATYENQYVVEDGVWKIAVL
jgi:hypothetical protein